MSGSSDGVDEVSETEGRVLGLGDSVDPEGSADLTKTYYKATVSFGDLRAGDVTYYETGEEIPDLYKGAIVRGFLIEISWP